MAPEVIKNTEFHSLFPELPESEIVECDASCALQKEILHQGRLYLTSHYICFYANIFGWVTNVSRLFIQLIIPLADVIAIEKKFTAMVFPNAIQVSTLHAKHLFASFISRDSVFDRLVKLWRGALEVPENLSLFSPKVGDMETVFSEDDEDIDAQQNDDAPDIRDIVRPAKIVCSFSVKEPYRKILERLADNKIYTDSLTEIRSLRNVDLIFQTDEILANVLIGMGSVDFSEKRKLVFGNNSTQIHFRIKLLLPSLSKPLISQYILKVKALEEGCKAELSTIHKEEGTDLVQTMKLKLDAILAERSFHLLGCEPPIEEKDGNMQMLLIGLAAVLLGLLLLQLGTQTRYITQ